MTAETFDLWTWKAGRPWTLEQPALELADAIRGTVRLGEITSAAAFASELAVNPNRITVDELADLAEFVAGPIPDVLKGAA